MHFKNIPNIAEVPLAPPQLLIVADDAEKTPRRVALHYNRIGGLLQHLASTSDVKLAVLLAVWVVESGNLPFVPGRPVLRFEVHKFFQHWGQSNEALFDGHFQCGGRNGIEGKPWTGHKLRHDLGGEWQGFHGDQNKEFATLNFAQNLGGAEAACLSASFGGPQILGSHFHVLGYASAQDMAQAFGQSECWQVCGFFDYCQSHDLISALRDNDWLRFAAGYNGPGQAAAYAALIAEAFLVAQSLLEQ